jgi:hypothetical protein
MQAAVVQNWLFLYRTNKVRCFPSQESYRVCILTAVQKRARRRMGTRLQQNHINTASFSLQPDWPHESHHIDTWLVERMTVPGQYIVTLCPNAQGV